MAAGYRNVVLPLGIYSGAVLPPDGGFATVIPPLRIAGPQDLGTTGGFGTPLGVLLIRSAGGIPQAGYYSIIPPLPLGGDATAGIQDETDGRHRRTYFTMIGRTRLGR